jgi:hypothetical protein
MRLATLIRGAFLSLLLIAGFAWIRFHFSNTFSIGDRGIHGLLALQEVDILFIGSSRTRFGYDANLVESRTGKTAYNLAYNGLSPAYVHTILKWWVESRGHRAKQIVIEAYPEQSLYENSLSDTRLFFDAPPDLKWALIETYTHSGDRIDVPALYALLVSSDNELFFSFPFHSLFEPFRHGSYLHDIYRPLSDEGFREVVAKPPASETAAMARSEVVAYKELCEWLRRTAMPAVFVEPPTPRGVSPTARSLAATSLLADLLQNEEEVRYLRPAGQGDFEARSAHFFIDSQHLSGAGRSALTRWIINELAL